jgi:hypothetical protein
MLSVCNEEERRDVSTSVGDSYKSSVAKANRKRRISRIRNYDIIGSVGKRVVLMQINVFLWAVVMVELWV